MIYNLLAPNHFTPQSTFADVYSAFAGEQHHRSSPYAAEIFEKGFAVTGTFLGHTAQVKYEFRENDTLGRCFVEMQDEFANAEVAEAAIADIVHFVSATYGEPDAGPPGSDALFVWDAPGTKVLVTVDRYYDDQFYIAVDMTRFYRPN